MNLRISQAKVPTTMCHSSGVADTNYWLDWTEESTDLPTGNSHLWEESWDDDDTNDDFSAQLK